jgi:hypothetical protein
MDPHRLFFGVSSYECVETMSVVVEIYNTHNQSTDTERTHDQSTDTERSHDQSTDKKICLRSNRYCSIVLKRSLLDGSLC